MNILVQKFGGTSLSGAEARERVVSHIKREKSLYDGLVVVVSAMGRSGDPYATDTLLSLAGFGLAPNEKDLLLGCGEIVSASLLKSLLYRHGIGASVFTGGAAGIRTDDSFGEARITAIRPEALVSCMQEGRVAVVTGFQGATEKGEMTTLGRGGSDTTATALGAALHAARVDIYTDVDGILTADPRLVGDAKPLSSVTYTEICNMAWQGAKVIHPRAVEIAAAANIPVRVRSTFSEGEGTLVASPDALSADSGVRDRFVTGIAHVTDVTQISVTAPAEETEVQMHVFRAMARSGISVDFINVTPAGAVYTVLDSKADEALRVLEGMGYSPTLHRSCAKVAVVGGGINGVPGIMASIVEALTGEGITILQSADSNTTIWVLVRKEDLASAVRALHAKFELHR